MQELKALAKYFKSFAGIVTGLLAALPFAGLASDALAASLVPPWGGALPLAIIASVTSLSLLFVFMRQEPAAQIRQLARRLVFVGAFCVLVYVSLRIVYVFEHRGSYTVTGFALTDYSKELIQKGESATENPLDLLGTAGYGHAEQLWKFHWLAEILIVVSFCAACAAFPAAFFLMVLRYVALDRERQVLNVQPPTDPGK